MHYRFRSKITDERSTPKELFDPLNKEFKFDIDLAASIENTKCAKFYSIENSAFHYKWYGNCFCNPPYSNIYTWLSYGKSQTNCHIVYILPCDTSTKWFHDFIWDERYHCCREDVKIRFPKGRFKFGKYTIAPKFATIITIYDHRNLL